MSEIPDDLLAALQDLVFGGAAYTPATTIELFLSSTEPQDDGTGITEPVGNGYVPPTFDNDLTTWEATADRIKTNAIDLAYPEGTGDAGDFDWYGIRDADTGALLDWGVLGETFTWEAGAQLVFPAGSLVVAGPPS